MSADNYVVIVRTGKRTYTIYEECASVEPYYDRPQAKFTSLQLALQWAETYCREHNVEYGIHYKDL